jgi:CDP-diacylglycerol pyrophosphatase
MNKRALFLVWFAMVAPAARADPDALWKIVHDQCVPSEQSVGDPAPCAVVDLAGGYAILKDRRGATQFLVIPTAKIAGIESPEILAPDAPNYWRAAWDARRLVEQRAGMPIPRDDIGMVVNSAYGRSQNQLHIHVDCIRPDVIEALHAAAPDIGSHWKPLGAELAGHRYRAMRLDGAVLSDRNPFNILAAGDAEAGSDMGRETLAVMGATLPDGRSGFFLLSDRDSVIGMDVASSESLLDHDCAVLKTSAR